MCRIADKGPYAIGNVYCGTCRDNVNDVDWKPIGARHAVWLKEHSWLKGTTGADHPRSKAVTTPAGAFPSMTAAAAHYGISRPTLRDRLAKWGSPTKPEASFDNPP
jgi:hypothetical protein